MSPVRGSTSTPTSPSLELVDPGLTPMLAWRPDDQPADPQAAYYWAGVARKP
jgi:hypothetical protein